MKEEEVRSRHRALLLQLREKALKVQIYHCGGASRIDTNPSGVRYMFTFGER